MKSFLKKLFEQFESALEKEEKELKKAGGLAPIPKVSCKIVGQMALLVADLPFDVASTIDIDILFEPPYAKTKTLEQLCLQYGLTLESDHRLIWMPKQTEFHPLFQGRLVKAVYADPLYVIASKCKFKREKDKKLIQNYFSHFLEAEEKITKMEIDTRWINS